MKIKLTHVKEICLGFTMILICCSCQENIKSSNASSGASSSSKIQAVEVINPSTQSFSSEILITGKAMPNQSVMLKSMESGYLNSIKKDIGDEVKRGDVIAQLKNPELSQLVTDANSFLSIEESKMLVLQSDLAASEADMRSKVGIYNRLKEIMIATPQLTPKAEVDRAQGEAEVATARMETIKAKISAHHISIDGMKKRLENANLRYASLTIRAPFDGIITNRYVDKGSMIQSGLANGSAGVIVAIQDVDPIRLTLPIPESDAGAIVQGMEVEITFPERIGKSITGKVSRTSGVLDASSKTMQVEVDIPNQDRSIISGMYAKAQIQLSSRKDVLALPNTAQILYQDQLHLLLVEDGKVRRILLRKGLEGKDNFEVLNPEVGLQSQIIINGKSLVKAGQEVKPVLKIN